MVDPPNFPDRGQKNRVFSKNIFMFPTLFAIWGRDKSREIRKMKVYKEQPQDESRRRRTEKGKPQKAIFRGNAVPPKGSSSPVSREAGGLLIFLFSIACIVDRINTHSQRRIPGRRAKEVSKLSKAENTTARYKVISDAGGNRYRFFCERSGMAMVTTKPFHAGASEEELRLAWESEGRQHFNRCGRCGKWVSDAMFNLDVSECVICTPWEEPSVYCPHCGAKTLPSDDFCRGCGARLQRERSSDVQ